MTRWDPIVIFHSLAVGRVLRLDVPTTSPPYIVGEFVGKLRFAVDPYAELNRANSWRGKFGPCQEES